MLVPTTRLFELARQLRPARGFTIRHICKTEFYMIRRLGQVAHVVARSAEPQAGQCVDWGGVSPIQLMVRMV